MIDNLRLLFSKPTSVSMKYMSRASGRTVSVTVLDDPLGLKNLCIKFERKIESGDVVDGKLISLVREKVKRRGGKRSVTIALSYESAKALRSTLDSALKDARKRRMWWRLMHVLTFSSSVPELNKN